MSSPKPRESEATEGRGGETTPPERWSARRKKEVERSRDPTERELVEEIRAVLQDSDFLGEGLYLHHFESLDEARQEIDACIERYNRGWLLERHGYQTPAQVRQELTLMAA